MFTVIDVDRPVSVDARVQDGRVWLSPGALQDALGWHLEGDMLCREEMCVPVRGGVALQGPHGVDLAALADVLGRPLALDVEESAASLGAAAPERAQALRNLDAPDFTLPDVRGRQHSLSEQRGRKVLMVVWASW